MGRHPDDKAILAFALPALGSLAADPLVSAVDTAFVGRLGTESLGALGVNAGVFSLAFLVFNFLAYGTTPLVAGALGQDKREEAGRIVSAGLALAVAFGALGVVGLLAFDEAIVAAMGAGPELVEPTLAYLRIRAWAAPAVLLLTIGNGAFRGYGDTRTPLWLTLGLNFVNLVLDPLLIFGLGWGIEGAAAATTMAQWLGGLGFVGLLFRGPVPLAMPTVADVRALLGVGSVLSVRTVALVFTMTVTTSLATRFGKVPIAAHQVAMQLWLMFALIVDAFALAGQSLIADHLGAGRVVEARRVGDRLLVWGLRVGVGLTALLLAGWPLWPRLFDLSPEVAAALASVLPIVALMQPLNAVVFVFDGIFIGAKAFGTLAWQMVLATSVTLAALAWVWSADAGLLGIWCCMVVLIAARGAGQGAWYWGRRILA
ncbi:MAG: MATE family efflux transporter [Deltaproteobacteria bacterium]|nr:MAG: MATE family efflux transporter [Deltaproteobacteria bacterium]